MKRDKAKLIAQLQDLLETNPLRVVNPEYRETGVNSVVRQEENWQRLSDRTAFAFSRILVEDLIDTLKDDNA